jgi:hypothetical protein
MIAQFVRNGEYGPGALAAADLIASRARLAATSKYPKETRMPSPDVKQCDSMPTHIRRSIAVELGCGMTVWPA